MRERKGRISKTPCTLAYLCLQITSWCCGDAKETLTLPTIKCDGVSTSLQRSESGPRSGPISMPDIGWRAEAEACHSALNVKYLVEASE